MNEKQRQFDDEPDLKVSERFSDDLGSLFAPDRPIPPDIDRAVAQAARRHLARPQRRLWWFRWAVPATAAAAIAVACLWWAQPEKKASVMESPYALRAAVAKDIDGNGRVDILDAFVLAKYIETQQPMNATWDFNGDGLIDRRDVDTVAFAAVRLDKGV